MKTMLPSSENDRDQEAATKSQSLSKKMLSSTLQINSGSHPPAIDTSRKPTDPQMVIVNGGAMTAPHRLSSLKRNMSLNNPVKKRSSTIGPGHGGNFSGDSVPQKTTRQAFTKPRSRLLTPAASSRRVWSTPKKKPRRRSRRFSESMEPVNHEEEEGRLNHFRDAFINRQRQSATHSRAKSAANKDDLIPDNILSL